MNQYIEKKKIFFWTREFLRYQRHGLKEMMDPKGKEILVSMRNVDITYGSGSKEFKAVSDLNLNIYRGEVLGLVGESGSGKSTTGKALVGLIPYSFGEIKLMNQVLPKKLKRGFKFGKSLEEYKKIINFLVNKVQMIFQDPANSLNPHKNISEVVSEGLDNTKNSKEIIIYNFDQSVIRDLFLEIKKFPGVKDILQKEAQLNVDISENEVKAYKALYEEFIPIIQKNPKFSHLEDKIKEYFTERERLNSLSLKQCKKELIVDILKSVGLDKTVLRRYPLEFSGGQQQRIGISRAVVLRPLLLVADEPISALDVSIQAQVVNIFNELKEKYSLTIMFIAHDLRMVEYISDRIAVMNKGTLLEVGSTNEIMKNSLHPYTKSLLDAVPSIESTKGSLIGYVYDPNMHNYSSENQPIWIKVNDNHFLLATYDEYNKWKKGDYE